MRLNISRQDVCSQCHGQGFLESPGKCPECNGTGQITQTGGRMKFNVQCPRCHGTGKNLTTCPTCHGEGTVTKTEPLEVRIKAGTRDGQRIRVPGKGNAGAHGGAPGDLYAIIRTGEHPIFRRDGDDIYLTVPVSATEAALGAKIEVPTIDGRALLKIPPGTQSGQKLRLREKGVPSATKRRRARRRNRRDHGDGPHAARRAHQRVAAGTGQAEPGRPAGGAVAEGLTRRGYWGHPENTKRARPEAEAFF